MFGIAQIITYITFVLLSQAGSLPMSHKQVYEKGTSLSLCQ